jgi:hypothetical protein
MNKRANSGQWARVKYDVVSEYSRESALSYQDLVVWLGQGVDVQNMTVSTEGQDLIFKYPGGESVRVLKGQAIRKTLVKMLSKQTAA